MLTRRFASSCSLALATLFALGCGGAPKQAHDTEPVAGNTEASGADMTAPSETPASDKAKADAPASDAPAAAPAAAPAGPTTLKGKVSGGDFAPKVALLNDGSVAGPDVFVTIVDKDVSCEKMYTPDEGDRSVVVRLPWRTGSYDLSSKKLGIKFGIKRNGKALSGDATKGNVEVLAAPTAVGSVGRIRLKASAPKESVDGEIDVKVCIPVKADAAPAKPDAK